jgi:hypothetical protein
MKSKRIRNMRKSRIGWGDIEEVDLFLDKGDWRSAGFGVPFLYHNPYCQAGKKVYKIKITLKVTGISQIRKKNND